LGWWPHEEDKDWLYPQMIKAIKKVVANSMILVFFSYKLVKFNELLIRIRKAE
jgi:hypothetical protein